MIQILLADDHSLVRSGIRMLLEKDQEIKITGEAAHGKSLLEQLANGLNADIVLLDIEMPGQDGTSLINKIRSINPNIAMIILSVHEDEKYVTQAFNEGASGYLLKSVSPEELIFSVKHVHQGGQYLCAELTMKMLKKQLFEQLKNSDKLSHAIEFSSREHEVLTLISEGLTNHEISEKLFISKRTIEGHRKSLLNKTGVRNTAALIRFAALHGMIK